LLCTLAKFLLKLLYFLGKGKRKSKGEGKGEGEGQGQVQDQGQGQGPLQVVHVCLHRHYRETLHILIRCNRVFPSVLLLVQPVLCLPSSR